MTYEPSGGGAVDYSPCRYGASRLDFRGPWRRPDGQHVTVLGGTETYGKFIDTPYPDLLEQIVGRQVLNLGQQNAGLDVFLQDRTVLDLCRQGGTTVIELMGAQNSSNRFYAVHPRRNDRFLRATPQLRAMYPELDFTNYNFTRHLLGGLQGTSAERFAVIVADLKIAWVAQMTTLIETLRGDVVLLWMADRRPQRPGDPPQERPGPLFIDAAMIDVLRPRVAAVVEIVADAEELAQGYERMIFGEMDAAAAAEMLGPAVHRRAAQRLAEVIKGL